MEKIIWTDSVKSEEVLHRAKEERNILHRKCLLKHVIERKNGRKDRRGEKTRNKT